MQYTDPLIKALEITGGQSALARAAGNRFTQRNVWNWLNRDKKVSAKYVLDVEAATNGKVTRYELRPDIFGFQKNEKIPEKH